MTREDQPATAAPEPHMCTAADPWTPAKNKRAIHPDAVDAGECSEGCCDRYRCPHCGHRWLQELAQ